MLQTAVRTSCVVLALLASRGFAAETDAARAPTGEVTDPKGLLADADGTEFRFSYFPSLDRIRLLVLHTPPQFVRWEIEIAAEGRHDVLVRGEGKLPMTSAGETIATPSLGDGTYEVRMTLIARDGTRRELRRTFQRKHFAWEKSRLGQDRVIVPPFTPLVATDDPPSVSRPG